MKKIMNVLLTFSLAISLLGCKQRQPDPVQLQHQIENLKLMLVYHSYNLVNDVSTTIIDTSSIFLDSTTSWHTWDTWEVVSYGMNHQPKVMFEDKTTFIIGSEQKSAGYTNLYGLRIDSGKVSGFPPPISSSHWQKTGERGRNEFKINTAVLNITQPDSVIEEVGMYFLTFVPNYESQKELSEVRDTGHYTIHWIKQKNKIWRPVIISPLSSEQFPSSLLQGN
jgi:hypothetical protein